MNCTCAEAFGQLYWSPDCTAHQRCPEMMRGIPIQCILTAEHHGAHK